MAKVTALLDTRLVKKNGKYPLKIKVHHKNNYFLINLRIDLLPEHWIDNRVVFVDVEGSLSKQEKKMQDQYNEYIDNEIARINSILLQLHRKNQLDYLSIKELKPIVATGGIAQPEAKPILFAEHAQHYMESMNGAHSFSIYKHTLSLIGQFADLKELTFEQMNYGWMKDFEIFLKKKGLAINTVGIRFRNIRTIFNDAIDRDIIPITLYPFRKFKIAKQATRKRYLTIDQLRIFCNYECEPHQEQYRDMFMLIFYLGGINIGDLCNLKEVTSDGYIEYERAKTKRPYKIKVEPEAMKIIEKYKGEKYLLNILDRYNDYHDYISKLNKNLKQIGKMEITSRKNGRPGKREYTGMFPEISTYWARHSWATVASHIDIPKDTIAQVLGHGNNTVTDIYIAPSQKKSDEAIRKVIDAIK